MYEGSITDIKGLLAGHAHDLDARTGVSVVICPKGATGGVDVRGGSPGTRETDVLLPGAQVDKVHAVALCGGSAFGLNAASGIMAYLEWKNIGYDVGITKVPIVPAAVIFDLGVGKSSIRPDGEMGYEACINANNGPFVQGRVGVGAGATVGKLLGDEYRMDGGVGSASMMLPGGVMVASVMAVNALGDVVDYLSGEILAGAKKNGRFLNTLQTVIDIQPPAILGGRNTTIGIVATNAKLDKMQAQRLASISHDGLAMAIRPVHTQFDGDTIFTLSTNDIETDTTSLYAAAPVVVARAIANAVLAVLQK